jgi:hypothetical protein
VPRKPTPGGKRNGTRDMEEHLIDQLGKFDRFRGTLHDSSN